MSRRSQVTATLPCLTAEQVLVRYDAVLLDAYGVLVDGTGALPGAASFIDALDTARRPWLVVSNDASRSIADCVARYAGLGLSVAAERIVVSASLLAPHFADAGLAGARTVVLGPAGSQRWATEAGADVVPWYDPDPEAIVVCDDAGYPFVEAVEAILTHAVDRLRAGHRLALILVNPDRIYPAGNGRIGLTAGTTALAIESGLAAVLGPAAPRFVALGKPHPPIFAEACRRLGTAGRHVVMLGDQMSTDIAGARAFGLSAGLVGSGVGTLESVDAWPHPPDFVLPSVAIDPKSG